MKIKYYVITKINGDNNFTPTAYKKDGKIYVNDSYEFDIESIPTKDWLIGDVYQDNFQVGELLIIDDETGREGAYGRSPRKWGVEWREFGDPEKAMRFSNKLIKKILDL